MDQAGVTVNVNPRMLDKPGGFRQRRSVDQIDIDARDSLTVSRAELNDLQLRLSLFEFTDQGDPMLERPAFRSGPWCQAHVVVEAIVNCHIRSRRVGKTLLEQTICAGVRRKEKRRIRSYRQAGKPSQRGSSVMPMPHANPTPQTVELRLLPEKPFECPKRRIASSRRPA